METLVTPWRATPAPLVETAATAVALPGGRGPCMSTTRVWAATGAATLAIAGSVAVKALLQGGRHVPSVARRRRWERSV